MSIKNFIDDYGADFAPADSSPALADWLTYAAANDGSQLIIPPGSYHWATTNGPTNGLTNARIIGYGASVDSIFIGNADLIGQDFLHSARIATANRGDTSVTILAPDGTLIGAADSGLFTTGRYIMVTGFATQIPSSFPPNFQYVQYAKVTGKAGGVLSLDRKLRHTFKSTWPYIDAFAVSINIGTSTFTCATRPIVDDMVCSFTSGGTLPTGITAGVAYRVRDVTGPTFKLALTVGGSAIALSGSQSGTHYFHAQGMDLGGPATIYALPARFDGEHIYEGLRCTQLSTIPGSAGRRLVLDKMYFDGNGHSLSVGIEGVIKNSQIGNQNELDKLVERAIYENCIGIGLKQILVQSSSVEHLIVIGSTLTTINGTALNTIINGSTISTLLAGVAGYGATEAIHVENSTVTTVTEGGGRVDLGDFDYSFSAGTFTVTNLEAFNANTLGMRGAFIPGHSYFYAFYDGALHKIDNLGSMRSFKVLDVRQDATNIYIDTDLVAEPVTTFAGQPANVIAGFACQQSSGNEDLADLVAPGTPDQKSFAIQFG